MRAKLVKFLTLLKDVELRYSDFHHMGLRYLGSCFNSWIGGVIPVHLRGFGG